MDCLDPSVIKKRKLTQSDYKVGEIFRILMTELRFWWTIFILELLQNAKPE